jgi:hypothetical protein
MLLIEMLLVVQEVQLPVWLFPRCTPHEIVTTLHQLFPAYLNGCRCITGAFYVDQKKHRELLLETISLVGRDIVTKQHNLIRTYEDIIYRDREEEDKEEEEVEEVEGEEENGVIEEDETKQEEAEGDSPTATVESPSTTTTEQSSQPSNTANKGKRKTTLRKKKENHDEKDSVGTGKVFEGMMSMQEMLTQARVRYQYSQEYRTKSMANKLAEAEKNMADPKALAKRVFLPNEEEDNATDWILIRDLILYWIARWIFVKTKGA